jgi:hypothetical protein
MFLFNKTLDQYGRVSWVFGCVLGSRPEVSPCPSSLCTPVRLHASIRFHIWRVYQRKIVLQIPADV